MKRAFGKVVIILVVCLGIAIRQELAARDILFGAIGGGTLSDLYILNPANGAATSLGPTGFSISGLRFDPTTGVLYGSTANIGASRGSLITLNPNTGTGTLVGSFGVPNHTMADIAFTRNGRLYGWAEPSLDDLHIINKATGAATDVGNAGLSTFGSGLAANSADVLYFTGNGPNGALRIVDKNTGLTTIVATMSGAPLPNGSVNALAFDSRDVLYAINGGDNGPNSPAHLVLINTTTGAVTDLGPTLRGMDALAFLFTNDPEEFAAIYEIGFSSATVQSLNLQRRMDDIRAGSRGFCADALVVTPSGKDYSGGKGVSDGKVVLPAPIESPIGSPMSQEPENKWGVFISGSGQFIDVDEGGFDRPGYDITTGSFTLGVDYRVCENFAIGLYGGYAHSDADFDDQLFAFGGGDVTVDSGKIGLYATWFSGGFYVDGAVGGGYNLYDTRRADVFGPLDGSTDGYEFSGFVAAGYDWHVGCFVFGPTVSLQYVDININSFTEDRTSILALEFPDQSEDSLRSTVGLRWSSDWKLGRRVILRTESRAVWKHEFEDTAYAIDSRFAFRALGSSILTVHGRDTGEDSALLSSGFSLLWNKCVSTYVYFDSEYGRNNYDNQTASAGIRLSF
jgi:outer membrane autotransporter protein